jgi:serine/threonine protein kinase
MGIVHRDLKPENVLMTTDSRPVIADFETAKQQGPETASFAPVDPTLTGLQGTPGFIAPEVWLRFPLLLDCKFLRFVCR